MQERLNVDNVMRHWKKEVLDGDAYPIIAVSMPKSGNGHDMVIHYAFSIPPEKLKVMLQVLIDSL